MKLKGIAIGPGLRLDKNGKLIKVQKPRSVSEIIRQRTSKRVKVAK